MNNKLIKQQRQILIILTVSILLLIWGAASYFSEHSSLTAEITVPPLEAERTPNKSTPAEEQLMLLMQKLHEEPNNPQIFTEISQIFVQINDWVQAENFASRALALRPNDPELLYIIGISQYNQEKHTEAALHFEKALQYKDDPSTQYSLGILYLYYLNKKDPGKQCLQKALEHKETSEDLKQAIIKELSQPK